ncbi:MAG: hypothetical protein ACI8TQ_002415, partial [Planctomycetota bacterium]
GKIYCSIAKGTGQLARPLCNGAVDFALAQYCRFVAADCLTPYR